MRRQDLRQPYPVFTAAPATRAPIIRTRPAFNAWPWLASIALACAVLSHL